MTVNDNKQQKGTQLSTKVMAKARAVTTRTVRVRGKGGNNGNEGNNNGNDGSDGKGDGKEGNSGGARYLEQGGGGQQWWR